MVAFASTLMLACGGAISVEDDDAGSADAGLVATDASVVREASPPTVDSSTPVSNDGASDADSPTTAPGANPDGSPGDGCTYVSGSYGCGAGSCPSVYIKCPATIDLVRDCATACPLQGGMHFATRCYGARVPDAGDGMVLVECSTNGGCCQG